MNDEILKLANELKITCVKGDREEILTTFARAIAAKQREIDAKMVETRWVDTKMIATAIRNQKVEG